MMNKKMIVVDAKSLKETVKDIIKDPPIDFNPDDFKDRETYERDTAVFMEGFNAALELIHDILADELPIEGEQDFTS